MIRTAFAAAAFTSILALTPAFAQSGGAGGNASHNQAGICQDRMERAQVSVSAIQAPDKKASAMKELDMAKQAMAQGDQTKCMVHTTQAEKLSQ